MLQGGGYGGYDEWGGAYGGYDEGYGQDAYGGYGGGYEDYSGGGYDGFGGVAGTAGMAMVPMMLPNGQVSACLASSLTNRCLGTPHLLQRRQDHGWHSSLKHKGREQ